MVVLQPMTNPVNQSLFIRTLQKQTVERTPIWLMRQAGRYLPEYRQTRTQAGDFLTLCKTPELACEVALQPLRRYSLDAAILFSDILTIPDAMKLGLYFTEGEGPAFHYPLRTKQAIEQLPSIDVADELDYVLEAARLIRQAMPAHLPLIGFSGSPWTLACYMVEGKSSRDFKQMFAWLYKEPEWIHRLLHHLTDCIIDYLRAQVEAGVNALMVFDTWGGLLTTVGYQAFSLDYMHAIVSTLKGIYPHIPIILFTKGGGGWLTSIAETGCDAIGVDWTFDLGRARQEVGTQVVLQGNLHPAVLSTSAACVRQEVANVLSSFGPGSGHIFNLGHGITPDASPDVVAAMIDAVHELSPAYHC